MNRMTSDRVRKLFFGLCAAAALYAGAVGTASGQRASVVESPNRRIKVDFRLDDSGVPRYALRLDGRPVLLDSRLGLVRDDDDFTRGLRLVSASRTESVRDDYEILTAKRRVNSYRANRRVFRLQSAAGRRVDVVFQVSDDGAAFRYFFPGAGGEVRRLTEEVSSFRFPAGTRAWLQPMSVARSGWEKTNPSYEEFYEKDIPAGTPSTLGAGWVYPALFRAGETWVLLSEAAVGRNYCGTRLRHASPGGEYTVGFPDARESGPAGPVNPESKLPWLTPWRVVVVGSLKTVAESTLGIDLADAPKASASPPPEPGKASWSWPLLGDAQTKYDTQRRFIDYAADMGWRYCLIDALWDKQIGYEKVKELIDYARGRGVRILLWYNSAGDWNTSPQTPRNLLLTRAGRRREFERLKAMGVAGLKVDFFGGDGQSVVNYYLDILEDAGAYGFVLNFHGATLPRGWQRTYPHLMTMEAIRGLEFSTFTQKDADEAPAHGAMLPFTRNVFDPMDYTPVVLDRLPRTERRTTSAYELALSVLFTSGIQHYAEIPEGAAKAPGYVREFLRGVPAVWDDTRFLDGHPGRFAVLARRGAGRWYVAGVNGEAAEKRLSLDLRALGPRGRGTLIADGPGGNLSFREETIRTGPGTRLQVTLPPRGGFVAVFE